MPKPSVTSLQQTHVVAQASAFVDASAWSPALVLRKGETATQTTRHLHPRA